MSKKQTLLRLLPCALPYVLALYSFNNIAFAHNSSAHKPVITEILQQNQTTQIAQITQTKLLINNFKSIDYDLLFKKAWQKQPAYLAYNAELQAVQAQMPSAQSMLQEQPNLDVGAKLGKDANSRELEIATSFQFKNTSQQQLKLASITQQSNELKAQLAVDEQAFNLQLSAICWQIIEQQQQLSILNKQQALLSTLNQQAKQAYNAGLIAKVDATQLEIELLNHTQTIQSTELALKQALNELYVYGLTVDDVDDLTLIQMSAFNINLNINFDINQKVIDVNKHASIKLQHQQIKTLELAQANLQATNNNPITWKLGVSAKPNQLKDSQFILGLGIPLGKNYAKTQALASLDAQLQKAKANLAQSQQKLQSKVQLQQQSLVLLQAQSQQQQALVAKQTALLKTYQTGLAVGQSNVSQLTKQLNLLLDAQLKQQSMDLKIQQTKQLLALEFVDFADSSSSKNK